MARSTAWTWDASSGDPVSGWEPARSRGVPSEIGGAEALHEADRAGDSGSLADFSIDLGGGRPSRLSDSAAWRRHRSTRTAGRADAEPLAFPEPGEVLAGFRIVGELGRGAFARVYLAEQADLAGRRVALKVAAALGDEPKALARLQHTHIVPIHSVHDDPESGLRLLCMPYFGGANLAQVLATSGAGLPSLATGRSLVEALDRIGGRAPSGPRLGAAATRGFRSPSAARSVWGRHLARFPWWGRIEGASPGLAGAPDDDPGQPARQYLRSHTYVQAAAWIAARLAEALDHAHARGLLHRDLKPSNILIAADGTPMLLDFNLAVEAAGPDEGERALVGGTLPYMAPEHIDAFSPLGTTPPEAVDARSDLYALGLILFEMLAGHHPFSDPSGDVRLAVALSRMIEERRGGAPALRASNPMVPPSLEAIVNHCLEPEPSRRYQRARDLAEDLRCFLDDLPLKHLPEPSLHERATKWLRRHPGCRGAGPVAALSGTVLAFLFASAWALADRAEVASARLRFAAFQAEFAECQLLLNTNGGPVRHLARGIARAERALAAYRLDVPGRWSDRPEVRRLRPAQRRELREQLSELILLLARARTVAADRDHDRDARLRADRWAVEWLDRAAWLDPAPPAELYRERASHQVSLGLVDLADADRRRAEAITPADARAFYLRGTALAAVGRTDAAERDLARAVALDARRFWAWFALGLCHFDQRRFGEAAADFSACTILAPRFAWPHLNRGLALAADGRLVEARAAFDRALGANPNFLEALVDRALTCLELDDPRAALRDLDHAARLGRRDANLRAARAEALGRLGRRSEAEREFAGALRQRPADPRLLVARGSARLESDPAGARDDFRRALTLDPRAVRAELGLAYLERPTDPRAALAHVERALAIEPNLADALRLRALIRAHQADRAAIGDAEALTRAPTPHNLYNAACALAVLSETARDAGLVPRARDLLRRALDAGFPADRAAADPDLKAIR